MNTRIQMRKNREKNGKKHENQNPNEPNEKQNEKQHEKQWPLIGGTVGVIQNLEKHNFPRRIVIF